MCERQWRVNAKTLTSTNFSETQRRKLRTLKASPSSQRQRHHRCVGNGRKQVARTDNLQKKSVGMKRKASTLDHHESNGFRRKNSISDSDLPSEAPSGEDSEEVDFDIGRTRKKYKSMPAPRKKMVKKSKTSGSRKPAPETSQATVAKSKHHAATPMSQKKAASAQKRKMDEAEILELDDTSTSSSPKRQTTEANRASISESRISAAKQRSPFLQPGRKTGSGTSRVPSSVLGQISAAEIGYTRFQEPLRSKKAATDEASSAQRPATNPQSADDVTALDMVKDLAELVGVLMREQVTFGFGMNKAVESRLQVIRHTIEREPSELMDKMLQDTLSADRSAGNMRQLVQKLIGRQDPIDEKMFPMPLKEKGIDRDWQLLREYIRDAFESGDDDLGLGPKPEDAGYVAGRMNDLAKGDAAFSLESSQEFMEDIKPCLESGFLMQSVLAALLCHWLFSGPEPMCDDVYSDKERKMYEAVLLGSKSSRTRPRVKYTNKL